ncbi:MAG: hypothetical protein ACRENE_10840 [Polyangiaceae bacterium]
MTRALAWLLTDAPSLPAALGEKLRAEGVTQGWLRAGGILRDVVLRTIDARTGAPGPERTLDGAVQAVTIEGAVRGAGNALSFSLRAVLARESAGAACEIFAGEIQSARVVELEVLVTSIDPVAAERGWSGAVAASDQPESARPAPAAAAGSGPGATPAARMPPRPSRPGIDFDALSPEEGDAVDHFLFGRSDVLKSDGDRLHLRVQRDGRVKEIALQMLRVTHLGELPAEGTDGAAPRRLFKLDRRL